MGLISKALFAATVNCDKNGFLSPTSTLQINFRYHQFILMWTGFEVTGLRPVIRLHGQFAAPEGLLAR